MKRSRTRSIRQSNNPTLACLGGALVMLAGISTPAQEALRSSLEYDQAVRANQNPVVNLQPDRPHLGPVQLLLGVYGGVDLVDNVNNTQTDPQSDMILRGGVNAGLFWPATAQSELSLNTGLGYIHYLKNPQYDSLEITPNSVLSWNVGLGDVSLTLYDQFSFSQQVVSEAALSGVARFPIFDETIGTRVDWKPGQWDFEAGYSHDEYFSDSSLFEYLDRSSEYFFARGGWRFAEMTEAGLETSASFTSYRLASQSGDASYSIGPFANWQITQSINATLRGGPTFYVFDSPQSFGQGSTLNSYYVDMQVSQQLTQFVSHQIDINRSVTLGVNQGSQFVEQFSAGYTVSWAVTSGIGLSLNGSYQHGTQTFQNLVPLVPGFDLLVDQTEIYDLYSAGPSISWRVNQKLSASLAFNHYLRKSNLPDRGYTQNNLSLDVNYAF